MEFESSTACRWLMERVNYERAAAMPYGDPALRPQRMQRLLAELGDPHQATRVIHIAGTKGKGSTASMAASVLQAAGYRTGLYTSPHIERVEERLVVDGRACSAEEMADLIGEIRPAVETLDRQAQGPTFFEIITAAAFRLFAQRRVDLAVMEVGLGGRLDSTNACIPLVCILTNISRDHTRQLGRTLALIAGEKAGILKPGTPAVSGVMAPEARQVVRQRAALCQAPLAEWGEQFGCTFRGTEDLRCTRFDYWQRLPSGEPRVWEGLRVNLLGDHQALNASLALAALHQLGPAWEVDESAARAGLEAVACPARIEVVGREPLVVLDTAHNAASAQALRRVLESAPAPAGRRWLVLTATQGKDVRGILRELLPAFDRVLLTRYRDNPRGLQPEALYWQAMHVLGEIPTGHRPAISWHAEPDEAWRALACQAGPSDLVCVTGSFFFAAEARRLIRLLPVCAGTAEARRA